MAVQLFDASFYRAANPDLATAGFTTDAQLLSHFQTYGLQEDRLFSPFVNLDFYRSSNSDIASYSNQQLFNHLQTYGIAEGRRFFPVFDLNFYRAKNSDLTGLTNEQLFQHLGQYGLNENRRFSQFFDPNFYRAENSDLSNFTNLQALEHLDIYGFNEKREFSQYFDINYYRASNPDLVTAGLSGIQLLEHFETYGLSEGRQFSVAFDVNYYRNTNSDLVAAGFNNSQLYNHFEIYGLNEGRASAPFFDVKYYLNNNSDLKALGYSNQQAYNHFVNYGLSEERIGSNLTTYDYAGNSASKARNIAPDSPNVIFRDFIGTNDTIDFYSFNVSTKSNLNLLFKGLNANADVELLNSSGAVVQQATQTGTTTDTINTSLISGTYYIEVVLVGANTYYNLTLSATQTTPSFSSQYGYGLVDAAAAVAQALGQNPFPYVTNNASAELNDINAPEVWAKGYTGQGIVVAVVDIGVDYNHVDLSSNIWTNPREIPNNGIDDDGNGYIDDVRGWNFVDNNNNTLPPNTDYGDQAHGTHIAGIIAGENNGFGVTGVAYNAKIMPVRVLDNNGYGYDTNIAAGVRYAANNGAKVINLSLGQGSPDSIIQAALSYAEQKGAVVVSAVGNESLSQPDYPAGYATNMGIAVGAVDQSNTLANFSNLAGSTPLNYVVAPGVNIYSTTPNNSYGYFDGTSFSTAFVSGVVALMLSANPSLTPAQVERIITQTANPNKVSV